MYLLLTPISGLINRWQIILHAPASHHFIINAIIPTIRTHFLVCEEMCLLEIRTVKVNLSLNLTVQLPIKAREGMDVWLHAFLTWTLDTSELSCLRPDRFFYRERILVPTNRRVFVGPRAYRGALKTATS
jgi:hypothetical protein